VGNVNTRDFTALSVQGGANIRQLSQLTVQGSLTNSGAIHSIGSLDSMFSSTYGNSITGYVGIHVMGDATNNAGARIGGTGSEYVDFMSVAQMLFNRGPTNTAGRAEMTNVHEIRAGSLMNHGVIRQVYGTGSITMAYIDVANDFINGSNTSLYGDARRQRRDAEILSPWYYGNRYSPAASSSSSMSSGTGIRVGGNLIQYFDGSIRARGGSIDVGGELYNAGEIRITYDLGGTQMRSIYDRWFIRTGSIFNDGRLWHQKSETPGDNYPMSAWSGEAWGIIYDAQIETTGNLVNTGANAVINGMVESDYTYRWLPGDISHDVLYSMHVGGDLYNENRASIFNYSDISVHKSLYNQGATLVGGHWFRHSNLTDKYEQPMVYQTGRIAVWGNVYNTTMEELEGVHYGGLIASFDDFYVHGSLYNDNNSMITGTYTHNGTGPYSLTGGGNGAGSSETIYGRRASIRNGVLLDSNAYHDAPSVLTVRGIVHDTSPGQTQIWGLYNEGHIREIDIINVGSNEDGVLWNAFATLTPDATLPTSNGTSGTAIAIPTHFEGPAGTPSTITDIGVINATNLINEGTISDIDVAINVSYALINLQGGELDGLSTSHVEWTYGTNGMPTSGMFAGTNDMPIAPPVVQETTRADLRVGKATAANPYVTTPGVGIINTGTITNFDHVTSLGGLYNDGIISNVTSVTVGSNLNAADRADMMNAGSLINVEGVTVSGDLYLETGSSFDRVGTITAYNDVMVNGSIRGGFQTLSARTGALTVTTMGNLTVDHGAVASGNNVTNDGTITNNGVINSALGILNEGTVTNYGTLSAYNNIVNWGTISGNGMVFIAKQGGQLRNESTGTIAGSLAVHGGFWNAGDIRLTDKSDLIRVTGGLTTIAGGTVDALYPDAVVGGQYLFLITDRPGDLLVLKELKAEGSGGPGTVLDFAPRFGTWNGTKYVAGEVWHANQYYWLEVQRAYTYGNHASTRNQVAVGNYIDMIGASVRRDSSAYATSGDNRTGLWNLFKQLDGISDNKNHLNGLYWDPKYADHQGPINPAALRALDELSGAIYATLGTTAVHKTGVVNSTLANTLRSDVFKFSYIGNPNNAIRGQAIAPLRYNRWGTLFGIGGSSKYDGNASGYDLTYGGIMAGIDRAFWTGTRIGAYLSVAGGDVTLKELDERTRSVDGMIGMYLRQEMFYGYGLASAGFGRDNYKTKRTLTMLDHTAQSHSFGNIGTVYLERGLDLPVYYSTLQPFASFQVVSVNMEKFNETMWNQYGNYGCAGLEGVKARTNSFKLGLGARASSQPVPLPWGQLAVSGNMAWYHDFAGEHDRKFVARFVNYGGMNFDDGLSGATFRVHGNDPKQDWFNVGVGLHLDRNSTRFFIDGNLYANERQSLFSGNCGIVTSW